MSSFTICVSASGTVVCGPVAPVMKKCHHKVHSRSFSPCLLPPAPSRTGELAPQVTFPYGFCSPALSLAFLAPFFLPFHLPLLHEVPSLFRVGVEKRRRRPETAGLLCLWEQPLPTLMVPLEPDVLLFRSNGGGDGQSAHLNSGGWRKEQNPEVLPK